MSDLPPDFLKAIGPAAGTAPQKQKAKKKVAVTPGRIGNNLIQDPAKIVVQDPTTGKNSIRDLDIPADTEAMDAVKGMTTREVARFLREREISLGRVVQAWDRYATKCLGGDAMMLRDYMDRIFGKPSQEVSLAGKVDTKLDDESVAVLAQIKSFFQVGEDGGTRESEATDGAGVAAPNATHVPALPPSPSDPTVPYTPEEIADQLRQIEGRDDGEATG